MDPETPLNTVPPLISAVLRGERPAPLHADDGGDFCYAVDAVNVISDWRGDASDATTLEHVLGVQVFKQVGATIVAHVGVAE